MLRFQEGVLSRLWALRARWASWAWLVAVASVLARLVLALRVLPAWPIPSRLPRALTPVDWTPRTLTTASPQRSCATSMTRCFATTRRPARWLQACPRCPRFPTTVLPIRSSCRRVSSSTTAPTAMPRPSRPPSSVSSSPTAPRTCLMLALYLAPRTLVPALNPWRLPTRPRW